MRNFKKFLTLVLAVMMVVSAMSFTTSAAVTNFEDVDPDNEALVKAVDLLEYMGITKGVSATEFGAEQPVTREQFALFMYRLMKGGKDAPSKASNTTNFADLEDQTYFYAISWANAKGIIQGTSDTTFAPKNEITLQDAYTMIVRALEYEEEEDLLYPHGYIDVAEQEGVELDAGLPSNLDYEDALTRGNMAIILYNAFFAETAVPEVDTKVVRGEDDEWYLKEVTTYPRLCEKHFGVKEVKYQAIATPHYATEDGEPTYDLGYDAIFFELVEDDETETEDVPDYYYLEPEDIGFEADELDDAFLGEFTMFITTDEQGDEIERVLFADCNMVKKTVSDLKLGTVSSNKEKSYFVNDAGEYTDAKLLSGKITTGSETIYAFNAPYTYIKPNYATGASDELKYFQRNENNIAEIDFDLENDDDVDFYVATIGVDEYDVSTIVEWPDFSVAEEDFDDYFTAQATELLGKFEQVYYEGLFEADLYDVDGDGVYEYIDYKPYYFFQVDSDEDYDFSDSDVLDEVEVGTVPYIYTNEATVVGAEFVDEDYVIGYVDYETETVKIAEVIKPTVDSVAKIQTKTGSVILGTDVPVNAGSAWQLVANMPAYDKYGALVEGVVLEDSFNEAVLGTANVSGLLDATNLDEEKIEFYIYDGTVLHFDGVDDNLKFTENLIIPLQIGENVPEREFNKETGERLWYIYAWVDGDYKYVPVETEDAMPEVIVKDEDDNNVLAPEYDQQLCTFSESADGVYTIQSLAYEVDDDGLTADEYDDLDADEQELYVEYDGKYYEYKGITHDIAVLDSEDEDEQVIVVGDEDVTMKKVAGTRFKLEDATLTRNVVLKAYTKILVLIHDTEEDEYEMKEFDAATFKASAETQFKTVTYLVSNNPDSESKEDLVLLFATVDDEFDFDAKKDKNGQRIVSLSTPGVDENGYYRNYYELFNPFTGAKESDVAGSEAKKSANSLESVEIATGSIVELKGGMVDEDPDDDLGEFDPADDAQLFWITEYDSADDFITVVPATVGADEDCKECFEAAVEAAESDAVYLEVNKETAITVLKYSDAASATKWGTMTLGDTSTLADNKKEFRCYSDRIPDSKGNLQTKQVPYLKAYLSTSEADDEDDYDVVDYMIIVVTEVENKNVLLSAKDVHEDVEA